MGMHSLFYNFLSNFLIILRPQADPTIEVLSRYTILFVKKALSARSKLNTRNYAEAAAGSTY